MTTVLFINWVFPASKLASNPRLGNCEKYFQSERDCYVLSPLSQVLSRQLNISIKQVPNCDDKDNFAILKLCEKRAPLDINEIRLYSSTHAASIHIGVRFMYCVISTTLERPSWYFFLTPFQPEVWVGILGALFLFWGVGVGRHGLDLNYMKKYGILLLPTLFLSYH